MPISGLCLLPFGPLATGWQEMPTVPTTDRPLPPTPSRKGRGRPNFPPSPMPGESKRFTPSPMLGESRRFPPSPLAGEGKGGGLFSPHLLFLTRKLGAARNESWTVRELRLQLMGVLPSNSLVILFERMGGRIDLRPGETALFARESKIPEAAARQSLSQWIRFMHPRQFPEDPAQWSLAEALSPHTAALLLEEGPRLARDTFYNVVEESGDDSPRAGLEKTEARRQWEKFWEAFARDRGWRVKPDGAGMHPDLARGINYAKEAGWSLSRFYLWINKRLRHDKKREFILRAFEHAVDIRVLKGKRETAGRRTDSAHPLRKYHLAVGDSTFRKWVAFWSDFARERGEENALRREKCLIRKITEGQTASAEYRALFAEAARFREDRRGPVLQKMFQERGMRKEAVTAANILANINEKPRLPAPRLRVAGTGVNTMARVEKRLEELARDFRIPLKPKSLVSRRQQTAKEIGKRIQTLREMAEKSRLGPESFLQLFRTDPFLKILLGERRTLIPLILELWIEEQSAKTPADLAPLWKEHPFQEGGISIQQFRFWWKRFDSLKEEFGWSFPAAAPLNALTEAG